MLAEEKQQHFSSVDMVENNGLSFQIKKKKSKYKNQRWRKAIIFPLKICRLIPVPQTLALQSVAWCPAAWCPGSLRKMQHLRTRPSEPDSSLEKDPQVTPVNTNTQEALLSKEQMFCSHFHFQMVDFYLKLLFTPQLNFPMCALLTLRTQVFRGTLWLLMLYCKQIKIRKISSIYTKQSFHCSPSYQPDHVSGEWIYHNITFRY